MEISTRFITTKCNSKAEYFNDKYEISSKNKLNSLNVDENKDDYYLTLDEFCVELPLIIESSKRERNKNSECVKFKNERIEDFLR